MANACHLCRFVNVLCFWGPRRVVWWKRPALIGLSILIGTGLFALVFFVEQELSFVGRAAMLFLVAVSALGLVVGVNGCDRCVARLFGEV